MIMSITQIAEMLETQARLRAPENDEAGILLCLKDQLLQACDELEMDPPVNRQKQADKVDGYDSDDLGESPDY